MSPASPATSPFTGRLAGGQEARGRAWAYGAAGLGAFVSVAANIAHSFVPPAGATDTWTPPAGAIALAAFWPCALLLAVEVLARVSWPAGARWTLLRFGGVVPVAVVAAVVSYRHLSGLLRFYGEETLTVAIGPAAVDGLMVVATSALLANPHTSRQPTGVPAVPVVDDASALVDETPTTAVKPTSTTPATSSAAPTPVMPASPAPAPSSARPSAPSSARSLARSSASTSVRSTRRADEAELAELVTLARSQRPGAGEPTVRRLLSERGLSASAERVRAVLTAAPADATAAPTASPTTLSTPPTLSTAAELNGALL